MSTKTPILLSFYGLSNGKTNVFFGKLAYSPTSDLSFNGYDRWKTFKTIVALYRTRPVRHEKFELRFDHGIVRGHTDHSGSFWCEVDLDERQTKLLHVTLTWTGQRVLLTENLYPNKIQRVTGSTVLISDLDDTLIDSFVSSTWKQLKTLLFTTIEKRSAVTHTAPLLRSYTEFGIPVFYLSNSEQNLYPMLYRFMQLNKFPSGPMFLKQYVHVRKWAWRKIARKKNLHKRTILEKLVDLFPGTQFILLGDNTQHDLSIYLDFVRRYPGNVKKVIIREVSSNSSNTLLRQEATSFFASQGIPFYYGTGTPD